MNLIKKNSDYAPSYINLFDDILNRNWNDLFYGNKMQKNMPSVNIADHDNAYTLEVAAPGYEKDHFKINVENNVLSIKAEIKNEKEDDAKRYAHREYYYASFERQFTLPENVDEEKIEATYKNGVLEIQIPKKNVQPTLPSREINIQ